MHTWCTSFMPPLEWFSLDLDDWNPQHSGLGAHTIFQESSLRTNPKEATRCLIWGFWTQNVKHFCEQIGSHPACSYLFHPPRPTRDSRRIHLQPGEHIQESVFDIQSMICLEEIRHNIYIYGFVSKSEVPVGGPQTLFLRPLKNIFGAPHLRFIHIEASPSPALWCQSGVSQRPRSPMLPSQQPEELFPTWGVALGGARGRYCLHPFAEARMGIDLIMKLQVQYIYIYMFFWSWGKSSWDPNDFRRPPCFPQLIVSDFLAFFETCIATHAVLIKKIDDAQKSAKITLPAFLVLPAAPLRGSRVTAPQGTKKRPL